MKIMELFMSELMKDLTSFETPYIKPLESFEELFVYPNPFNVKSGTIF